ncbi:MAG TPA: hypothetical protein DCL41_06680 [Bdellovibrionales bacterium]|nr:hypothetical protein [Pseudobdellovibrionaceae bacterium]HAG91537.1 hypothetical protein [Bdellovibrionales bacterium]|tara:strand:+ start:1072 stop:1335 length:264 start_codon:yes stop_codon:yes gene_type:complete
MVKSSFKNQKGQAITEAVLMIVVLFAVTVMISSFFKEKQLLAGLIKKPWQDLSGLLQNGVWEDPKKSGAKHPATYVRHVSLEGEAAN